MHRVFRPMLAGSKPKEMSIEEFYEDIRYPVYATPKLDGIRCLTFPLENPIDDEFGSQQKCVPVTRYLKPIPNKAIRTLLSTLCPPYLDGEIVATGTFQNTQSAVMAHGGVWDFTYHVFDVVPHEEMARCFGVCYYGALTYLMRTEYLKTLPLPDFCQKLIPVRVERGELRGVVDDYLENKYEGSIIRSSLAPYKYGRSTYRQQWMIKVKQFLDDEATVVGYEEEMHNANAEETDPLGYKRRSSHQANMLGKNRLGALVVTHPKFGQFNVGSGFCAQDREELWRERETLKGRIITFRYQPQGVKDAPRCPIFKAFRDERDMDPPEQKELL